MYHTIFVIFRVERVSARPKSISFFQREILWTKKITFSSLFRPGENGEPPPSATENPADKRLSAFSSQEPLFAVI